MSTERIVECVPNFSEGRDRSVIDQIVAAMASIDGALVLDVDPGKATNRTVVTVVGNPDAVLESAFQGISAAMRLIDMRRHKGEHPRIGATDVCPFVPVSGITMDECAALARRLGERVGRELEIPVYLYEHAASTPARKNLADIRAGEYEGLSAKVIQPEWKPDFGPAAFHAKSGATVIGARKFLVAYNVNINSRAKRLATEISLEIREQGRQAKGPDGQVVRDAVGKPVMRPGRLKHVKAVGWYIDEYQRAQVSINLTDFEVSGLHDAFDASEDEARKLGARVTGSELVGLVPLDAMVRAGRHYLRRQGRSTGLPLPQVLEAAIQSLGLSELAPFDPSQRIIEFRMRPKGKRLIDLTVEGFVDELSSESPAPGGGSVAALCGSLAAGLSAMVANLTVGKKGLESAFGASDELALKAQGMKEGFLRSLDADTEAFHGLMAAMKLPGGTPEEKAAKASAMDASTRAAVLVPLQVLLDCEGVLSLAETAERIGNQNAASDAATAAACARAAAEGAFFNVLTNLKDYKGDPAWKATTVERGRGALERIRTKATKVMADFEAKMG